MINEVKLIKPIYIVAMIITVTIFLNGCNSENYNESPIAFESNSSSANENVSTTTPESETAASEPSLEEETPSATAESEAAASEPNFEEVAPSATPESEAAVSEPSFEEVAPSATAESEATASEPSFEEVAPSATTKSETIDHQITGNDNYQFRRNEDATISITAAPNTEYYISVYYSSGKSTAEGLHPKTTDNEGNVSWTWHIGGRTKHGTYKADISGNGDKFEVSFEIID